MDTAEALVSACAQGVAKACERELEWLVTRQSQTTSDARESVPVPSLPELISVLASGGSGGAAGFARVTYTDAIKALSQVRQRLSPRALNAAIYSIYVSSAVAHFLHLVRSPRALLKLRPSGASRCVLSTSA